MKLLTEEEKREHSEHVLKEGVKGCIVGAVVGVGLLKFFKYKRPVRYASLSSSIKAAIFAMPTISLGAFYADDGSVKFDEQRYQSDYLKRQELQALENYNKLSTSDKILHQLNENKYKIVVSAWAASLYGSWRIVNKDKYMTKAQKIVQARVYAQAITVVLLLGTLLLSMNEEKIKKTQPEPIPSWKKHLQEQEMAKDDPNKPPNVPDGWLAKFDEKYSTWFYVDLATKKSQWEAPKGTKFDTGDVADVPPPAYSPKENNSKVNSTTSNQSNRGAFNRHQQPQPQPQPNYGGGYPPQPGYGGYPPPQPGYGGYPPQTGYGGYPPPGGYYPPQGYGGYPPPQAVQQQPRRSGLGAGSMAMGVGGGLLGGMLLGNAINGWEDHERMEGYQDGYQDGFDQGGDFDGGDFGGDF
ncbi:RCF2 [Candida oxycetoniae]|uniref:RCF2 n=1 Tax=Candida oxycetoniae TaxID=497107 RepID=A0AAI9SW76_9ASCO|nr:RCF2 [Candida oxycetoniae]KAI3403999.2 RCF2 [Candida oxycetoniae]